MKWKNLFIATTLLLMMAIYVWAGSAKPSIGSISPNAVVEKGAQRATEAAASVANPIAVYASFGIMLAIVGAELMWGFFIKRLSFVTLLGLMIPTILGTGFFASLLYIVGSSVLGEENARTMACFLMTWGSAMIGYPSC